MVFKSEQNKTTQEGNTMFGPMVRKVRWKSGGRLEKKFKSFMETASCTLSSRILSFLNFLLKCAGL